jgi:hypothetical protein
MDHTIADRKQSLYSSIACTGWHGMFVFVMVVAFREIGAGIMNYSV